MANAQDPRGWLEACPELAQFASDPRIAAAIEAGDGAKLFAALQARRKGPRAAFEHRTLDAVLKRRRLFTSPMSGAPTLFTLNGFGSRIYGKSDVAADGTYVGTLFATAVYVPVWPLAQYLCWSSGKQFQFYGKVPLSRPMRFWRLVVGAGAAVAAVALALAIWSGSRETRAWVVNGLDVPVVVSGPARSVTVASKGRVEVKLAVGKRRLEARANGRVVEAIDVEVPRWTDAVVYNVLGAAPLYAEGSWYFPKNDKPAKEPEPPFEFYGGKSFVVRDRVPYRFTPAPQSIQMDKHAKREVRWAVDVMKGGWKLTANVLQNDGKLAEAAALAGRVAAAEPGDRDVLNRWLDLALVAGGPAAALAPAKAIAEAAPDDLGAQRAYAHVLVSAGRRGEAERIFSERAAKDPSSADAAYLRARVAEPAKALELFEALAKEHPQDPKFRRALAWRYYAELRWQDALREYGVLARLEPASARATTKQVATSLVAVGQLPAAAALVDSAASSSLDLSVAVLHAQLARLDPPAPPARPGRSRRLAQPVRLAQPPGLYLARMADLQESDAQKAAWRTYAKVWGHALAGEPAPAAKEIDAIPFPIQRDACRIMVAAAADPAAGLAQAAGANRAVLSEVSDVVALLLAGEAARLGRDDLAVALAEASGHLEAPGRAVVAFVHGEDPVELRDVDPEDRAALLLARARGAQASGRDAGALLGEVRANDPVRGGVAQAVARWPRPEAAKR